MNRLATAAWAVASISWLLTAHQTDNAPLAILYVLFAIASGYVALIHRDKENR